MVVDIREAPEARAAALVMHPHPDFGGNRFHPFVTGLYERLPPAGVTAARFDFSSSDTDLARLEALKAMESIPTNLPVILVGYSFGAGIAAGIDGDRVIGWYLLAPQAAGLVDRPLGRDPRPKAIVVPENDQFSPPSVIDNVTHGWKSSSVTTATGVDHFVSPVGPIVDAAVRWIVATGSVSPR